MIVAEKTQKISILVLFNVLYAYIKYIYVIKFLFLVRYLGNRPFIICHNIVITKRALRSTVASHDFFRCDTVCEGYCT